MTDPTWRRVTNFLLGVLWMVCCFGWATVFSQEGARGGVIGGVIGAVVGSWIQKQSRDSAEKAYTSLNPVERAMVDQALAVGELRGPLALRTIERDLAKARLMRAGGTTTSNLVGSALLVVIFALVATFAPSRPPLLVTATVAVLAGWGVLAFAVPSVHALSPEARQRLTSLRRAPLAD